MFAERTEKFPNLNAPSGNMVYEVERLLSFSDVKVTLMATQLSNLGFFYNSPSKKMVCFSCQNEHETKDCNITHRPSCNYKRKSISFYVDKNYEHNASSSGHTAVDSVCHLPSLSLSVSTEELDMKNEADRLKTFTKWNKNVPVEPIELACNGFYFKGFADVVVCAFCKVELRNWEQGDNVYTEHKLHNPSCPFLATVAESSKPIPNMNYEQNRLKTFSYVLDTFAVCTKALSQNGFYFKGPKDKVCCVGCKCELSNWKKDDSIRLRHQNQSPNCPFARSNESSGSMHYRSTVIFDRPKHQQFALLNDRLKTFINWPADKKQTPQLLAEAGFYHTGETDTVICYCCDGGLCNWDEEDDPWIEHARWYPRCTYVRQRKGDQFVASVKTDEFTHPSDAVSVGSVPQEDEIKVNHTNPGAEGPIPNSAAQAQAEKKDENTKITQSIRKGPTVLAVLELGYDENIVEYVLKKKIKETGCAFAKASLLLEAVVKYIEEFGSIVPENQLEELEQPNALVNLDNDLDYDNKLREENRLLKEQKTCKICLDDDLSMVFLPCGHFVSCATCAPSLKNCPLCRSQILGLVRAYMS